MQSKTSWIEMSADVMHATNVAIASAGGTSDHAEWVRHPKHAERVIRFIDESRGLTEENPYECSASRQIATFKKVAHEEEWRIPEETFARLMITAPAWPEGRDAFRSLRIRWGEGDTGVARTFCAHARRVKKTFAEDPKNFWCCPHLDAFLRGDAREIGGRIRLFAGNATHTPVVDWIHVDLGTHRVKANVASVQDARALADELLVVAWLMPEVIRGIDLQVFPGLALAGYEVNVPEYDHGEAWGSVMVLEQGLAPQKVRLYTSHRSRSSACISVPTLCEKVECA